MRVKWAAIACCCPLQATEAYDRREALAAQRREINEAARDNLQERHPDVAERLDQAEKQQQQHANEDTSSSSSSSGGGGGGGRGVLGALAHTFSDVLGLHGKREEQQEQRETREEDTAGESQAPS